MSTMPRLSRTERGLARRATNRLLAWERREFPSASDPSKTYVAMIQADGKLSCDCRGWVTKKAQQPRRCKHTDALLAGRPTRTDGDYYYVQFPATSTEGDLTR